MLDKYEQQEKIQKFLEENGARNVEVVAPDFSNGNKVIEIILKDYDAENYLKVKELIYEKQFVPKFQLFQGAEKDPVAYFEFMVNLKKKDEIFLKLLEDYKLSIENDILKVEVGDTLKAEKLNKINYFKIFKDKTGTELCFFSENQVINELPKTVSEEKKETANKDWEEISNISDLARCEIMEKVRFKGDIFELEERKTKTDWIIYKVSVTDYNDSIVCKFFGNSKKKFEFKKGDSVEIIGKYEYDNYANDYCITIEKIKKAKPLRIMRKDEAKEKRIELHARTNMTEMSSSMKVHDYAERAKHFGHKGMAITDLGVAYSFPHAFKEADENFKVIFGMEAYMVDDENPVVENPTEAKLENAEYVVFDIETTGFNPVSDKIIEIGAIKMKGKNVIGEFSHFVNPECHIPEKITELTTITDEMVKNAETIDKILPKFLEFIKGTVVVAHNAKFDAGFIRQKSVELGFTFKECVLDTLPLARTLLPNEKRHSLSHLVNFYRVKLETHHRAIDDAQATEKIFEKFLDALYRKGIFKISEINTQLVPNISNAETLNTMILVKNQEGLKDFYELVSRSHIEFFGMKRPRIPKSLLREKRENFLIASSAIHAERNSGELVNMYLRGAEKEQIKERAKFYDYIEIQPVSNYMNLIDSEEASRQQIEEMNEWFYVLGKELEKIVVAVGDTEYLDEDDAVSRNVLLLGGGNIWKKDGVYTFSDRKLYYKTTEEMLKEFKFLGKNEAFEVVVENTNKIADMIEQVRPVPKGFYPPEIEGAEEEVRAMTYDKLHELYGETPSKELMERVEKELNSIINNGFAVLYLTAQKLVQKSMDLGYIVGSRGSVGSSIVAYLMGITEVNALYPHYRCPKCRNSEFFDTAGSGVDLPDKECPNCGTKYIKDGHSIPFEVFMGFDGDKVPDIDLNFSGECQGVVQKYTEELFGPENVYRAGTISTLAEKNAFGFVKKYIEETGFENKRNAEVRRLAKRCEGARRTTGQHPGGMIVVPRGRSIYEFCPIQKPANDMASIFETTHFDYHVMDKQLVKLDMLGHDDPTTLKWLSEMTGIDIFDIPLDDSKVLSLFRSTEALGVKPEDIGSLTGTSGIPEFGTSFVKQMLGDTMPTTFAELVRISGLSHGTDVWLNNAQDYVRNGTATLNEIITVRDDIMNKLIDDGLDKSLAFTIMEFVRKGQPTKNPEKWKEYSKLMKKQGIAQWYIDSCEKIKYMFPKGHAAAYVIMAVRIAWFKVYYPKEFYTAFLNRKVGDFKLSTMFQPVNSLKARKEVLESQNNLNAKEKQELFLYEILIEMHYRGIELEMVDLYKSNANRFEINEETGKIRMPFTAVDGLGEAVADKIVSEREEYEFLSVEDLKRRTGLNKTVSLVMESRGCFAGIPLTSQRTLF